MGGDGNASGPSSTECALRDPTARTELENVVATSCPPQTTGPCAEGDGCASSRLEDTLDALAAAQEGVREERTLLAQYKAIAWGRVLTPVQVGFVLCSFPNADTLGSWRRLDEGFE